MSRQCVAIDLDDTLATTTQSLINHLAKTRGLSMQPGNISDSAYWAQYALSDEEAIAAVHSYELAAYPGLRVVAGVYDAIQDLAKKYDLMLLTSRDPIVEQTTLSWLDQHFFGLFKEVIFVGNPYVSQSFRSKAEICIERGISIVVDDSPSHIVTCAQLGLRSLLFGGYEWHGQVPQHEYIEQVADWPEVRRRLA